MRRSFWNLLFFSTLLFSLTIATPAQDRNPPPDATPLNLTQTVDGITVTLDWVYADSELVMIGYAITPPEDAGITDKQFFSGLRIEGTLLEGTLLEGTLEEGTVSDGSPLTLQTAGLRPKGGVLWRTWYAGFEGEEYVFKTAVPFTNPPESLDLVVNVRYIPPELRRTNEQTRSVAPEVAPEVTAEPAPQADTPQITEIQFAFTAPVKAPQIIEVNTVGEIDGINVTLTRAYVNYGSTLIELCHDAPEGWRFERVLITYGGGNVLAWPIPTDNPCQLHKVDYGLGQIPSAMQINVLSLARGTFENPQTVEDWRRLEPALNADGIYLDIAEDRQNEGEYRLAGFLDAEGVPVYWRPIMEKLDRYMIEAGLFERIKGNVEFTFDIAGGKVLSPRYMNNIYEITDDGELRIREAYTPITPNPEDIFEYRVAYVVNADALEDAMPAHQPDIISTVTGAQVFNTWADFMATTTDTQWDALIVHENVYASVDTAWTAMQVAEGMVFAGIQLSREQMNSATGRQSTGQNGTIDDLYDGYYVIYHDKSTDWGILEAVGDLSRFQVQLMVAVTRGFFG